MKREALPSLRLPNLQAIWDRGSLFLHWHCEQNTGIFAGRECLFPLSNYYLVASFFLFYCHSWGNGTPFTYTFSCSASGISISPLINFTNQCQCIQFQNRLLLFHKNTGQDWTYRRKHDFAVSITNSIAVWPLDLRYIISSLTWHPILLIPIIRKHFQALFESIGMHGYAQSSSCPWLQILHLVIYWGEIWGGWD